MLIKKTNKKSVHGYFFTLHHKKTTSFTLPFMKINHHFIAILSLLFLPCFGWAQTDYLIKLSGDTLKGVVRLLPDERLDRVQLIIGEARTSFTALQVRSVRKENITYKPVRYENTIRLMRVLIDGYLSLNAFSSANPNSWDSKYLTKRDGTGMEVPNLGFKKILSNYLSDCPEVAKRIISGDLNKRDVERIVDLYNVCLQTKTETAKNKPEPAPASADSEKVLAVRNFITKVEAENFLTKKDALDVLKDIQSKVVKNEVVPNYQLEGLKSYLTDSPALTMDLDALIKLLKK